MNKRSLIAGVLSVCLMLAMLPAAFAVEQGEANITPQTTMKELRENPSIKGSGYYTYCREMLPIESLYWQNKTLAQYAKPELVEDCAQAMNLVVENYNNGVQVTWQIYTPEEIEANPSLGGAQLFYYPASTPGGKYALVVPGNGNGVTSEMEEGGSAAYQLHEMGYTVFVLRYRSFLAASDNAPLQDLGRAVQLITENADKFQVQSENYALVCFSAGGQLGGLFANREIGYGNYPVPKPGVLLLSYPFVDFTYGKLAYHVLIDPGTREWRYYMTSLAEAVTDDYPPVYFWYGKDDQVLALMGFEKQGPALEQALETHEVPHKVTVYNHAPHSIGTGRGTESVNSCVAGMNYLIETYNAGTQITYKLFSPEEIAQDASRDRAELYYFPAEQPGAKYAVVLSGNALFYSGEMRGGVSTAWELHQQGYAVFALRYRIGLDATDNAPLEDLGRAIQFITANAQQFGVQTEDYALVGYSSGGQIAGIFGGKELGYPNYGVPKPGALLLAYPINNFYETKPLYHVLLDTDALERRYYDYNISDCVDADYPPTYFWYGQDDILLIAFNYWQQGPALRKALETYGVPYKESVYRHAPHGVGIGEGTDAEGWVQEAIAFWEEQCA